DGCSTPIVARYTFIARTASLSSSSTRSGSPARVPWPDLSWCWQIFGLNCKRLPSGSRWGTGADHAILCSVQPSCEQCGEIARGNDPRSFVTVEIEQPALVRPSPD